jgi:hypothetical protein
MLTNWGGPIGSAVAVAASAVPAIAAAASVLMKDRRTHLSLSWRQRIAVPANPRPPAKAPSQ